MVIENSRDERDPPSRYASTSWYTVFLRMHYQNLTISELVMNSFHAPREHKLWKRVYKKMDHLYDLLPIVVLVTITNRNRPGNVELYSAKCFVLIIWSFSIVGWAVMKRVRTVTKLVSFVILNTLSGDKLDLRQPSKQANRLYSAELPLLLTNQK